jgi:hypothetical protein
MENPKRVPMSQTSQTSYFVLNVWEERLAGGRVMARRATAC